MRINFLQIFVYYSKVIESAYYQGVVFLASIHLEGKTAIFILSNKRTPTYRRCLLSCTLADSIGMMDAYSIKIYPIGIIFEL